MARFITRAALVAGVALFAAPVFAQESASDSITVRAAVIPGVTLNVVEGVDVGDIRTGGEAGTAWMAVEGSAAATTSGQVGNFVTGLDGVENGAFGRIEITGDEGQEVLLQFTDGDLTRTGGGGTMRTRMQQANRTSVTLPSTPGPATFDIGAGVDVAENQPPGTYTGTVAITVTYAQ